MRVCKSETLSKPARLPVPEAAATAALLGQEAALEHFRLEQRHLRAYLQSAPLSLFVAQRNCPERQFKQAA